MNEDKNIIFLGNVFPTKTRKNPNQGRVYSPEGLQVYQMVKQIQAAQKAARKAIEATYFGTLTVTELQKVKNEKSKLMEESEVVVLQW